MRLKDFHNLDLTELAEQDQDTRPKRDHTGKKKQKGAGGAAKQYKKRLAEMRDQDAKDTDY